MSKKESNNIDDYFDSDLLFPSEYLRGADLRLKDVTVTIKSIEPRHNLVMKGGEVKEKPVIRFEESEKKFVLNKTNTSSIRRDLGPDPRQWIGKKIILCPEKGKWFGREGYAIRISKKLKEK